MESGNHCVVFSKLAAGDPTLSLSSNLELELEKMVIPGDKYNSLCVSNREKWRDRWIDKCNIESVCVDGYTV